MRVMLDKDLAELYGVETKALNRAVKRNIERFPERFMFQLTKEEALRCRFGTLNDMPPERGKHLKYLPYAFTEQGVSMLSAVLRSPTGDSGQHLDYGCVRRHAQLHPDPNRRIGRDRTTPGAGSRTRTSDRRDIGRSQRSFGRYAQGYRNDLRSDRSVIGRTVETECSPKTDRISGYP